MTNLLKNVGAVLGAGVYFSSLAVGWIVKTIILAVLAIPVAAVLAVILNIDPLIPYCVMGGLWLLNSVANFIVRLDSLMDEARMRDDG